VSAVTLQDVARAAGVHASTVSRALDPAKAALVNPETRARVQAVAQALGYRTDAMAMGLRRKRTNTIGVVVADIGNPFITPVLRGIENALEGRGVLPVLAETQDDHNRLNRVLDHLLGRKVDAIITTAARAGDQLILKKVAREVPVVLGVRNLPRSGLAAVVNDDALGADLAARHLIELGHRRIGQLRGPEDISSFAERAQAFAAYARRAGADVVEVGGSATRPTLPEGARLMRQMLREADELASALFFGNDLMALGALEVLRATGYDCPRDVSIVGFNDSQLVDRVNPPLTTLRLPGYELGWIAAERAARMIEEPDDAYSVIALKPELVVRASTAPRSTGASR
jgi:LacI family transcriptional regulator